MSKELIVQLRDDITGEVHEDVETRTFAIDGTTYELELSEMSWQTFLDELAPYITVSRKVKPPRKHRRKIKPVPEPEPEPEPIQISWNKLTPKRPARSKEESLAIRAWARENGYYVGTTGTIKAEIVAAYQEAEGDNLPS